MNTTNQISHSSFSEWNKFLVNLNSKKSEPHPFLIPTNYSLSLIQNLEQEISKLENQNPIKLVLVKRQLSFGFNEAA